MPESMHNARIQSRSSKTTTLLSMARESIVSSSFKLKNHLDNECPRQEIACPFQDCGCDYRNYRTAIVQHMKDSPGIHLNQAGKTITIQKRLLALYDERVTEQNKWIELLAKKLSGLEKTYGPQYLWRIDHYQVCVSRSSG